MSKTTFSGMVLRIITCERYHTFIIRTDKGVVAKTFSGPRYANYSLWKDVKEGDYLLNLSWKYESKKIIDADSIVIIE